MDKNTFNSDDIVTTIPEICEATGDTIGVHGITSFYDYEDDDVNILNISPNKCCYCGESIENNAQYLDGNAIHDGICYDRCLHYLNLHRTDEFYEGE